MLPAPCPASLPLGLQNVQADIVVLTRLIPEAHGTSCDERLEPISGCRNARILRVPFRDREGWVGGRAGRQACLLCLLCVDALKLAGCLRACLQDFQAARSLHACCPACDLQCHPRGASPSLLAGACCKSGCRALTCGPTWSASRLMPQRRSWRRWGASQISSLGTTGGWVGGWVGGCAGGLAGGRSGA